MWMWNLMVKGLLLMSGVTGVQGSVAALQARQWWSAAFYGLGAAVIGGVIGKLGW